jgi:sulfite reductase (NADPH) hemoprotein beta-component
LLDNKPYGPRPYCEIIRQWTILHPEFAYLPRKFKIAVSGSKQDRAATQFHDIGLHLVTNDQGEVGFKVFVGGGLGRTPVIGQVVRPFLEKKHLLSYLEAILRVYNLYGRRDNKYKARIKILVRETGLAKITKQIEAEWALIKDKLELSAERIKEMQLQFAPPAYQLNAVQDTSYAEKLVISVALPILGVANCKASSCCHKVNKSACGTSANTKF